jgi:phage tail-like protein
MKKTTFTRQIWHLLFMAVPALIMMNIYPSAGTGNATDNNPYRIYNYQLIYNGETVAGFNECEGLDLQKSNPEYREGSTSRPVSGLKKTSSVVFKRGLVNTKLFTDWNRNIIGGKKELKSFTVVLMDNNGKAVSTWQIINALLAPLQVIQDLSAAETAVVSMMLTTDTINRR